MPIDRKTASKLLRVSVRTVDRYIRRGKLPAHEKNGRILLDQDDIKTLQDSQHVSRPVAAVSKQREEHELYRDLYEETRRALLDYQQKLEQAQYRIGTLESGAGRSQISAPVHFEQPVRRDDTAIEFLRRDLSEKERELNLLKETLKKEQANRFVFTLLTYLLLALIPIVYFLMR